jgi:uncharacterized membrane protein
MSEIPPPSVPPSTPPPEGGSYTPPPPPPPGLGGPSGPGPGASSDRTLMLVLSYLGILALIPLITKKEDPDIQWHAKNGLAITVAWVVFWIAYTIIQYAMPSSIACAMSAVGCVLSLGWLVVTIMAIMKALKGQRLRVPVVSDFADKM